GVPNLPTPIPRRSAAPARRGHPPHWYERLPDGAFSVPGGLPTDGQRSRNPPTARYCDLRCSRTPQRRNAGQRPGREQEWPDERATGTCGVSSVALASSRVGNSRAPRFISGKKTTKPAQGGLRWARGKAASERRYHSALVLFFDELLHRV